ncbi:hypothetical protein PSDVSF_12330 [Pseudodesulfovibrio sediminis]|uniref:Lipoprotein n=1 Tax=Pseudodesulfovibrio sediminis TaxID=2810563 RepID=A0ABM7P544_9BACT|nr:hypothetical protein PSDVSF_12330 [Pseudodesulfovibrio sediminis]
MPMKKLGKCIFLLLFLVLGIVGCVKVPNVKVYADAIVDTKSEVQLIAEDFSESPNRTVMYIYKMSVPSEGGGATKVIRKNWVLLNYG